MPLPQEPVVRNGAFFVRLLLFVTLGGAAGSQTAAHPLKAPPLEHAHVYTFDQFYLPEDDDVFVTEGGLLLLAELNCAACHAAPKPWEDLIGPKPGPRLQGAGSRLDMDALWRFIRSPQHRKPGTQMPGLFAADDESAPDQIEAIVTYLSQFKAALPEPPPANAERGKQLYHSIGCVACHEPGADYRPASLPPNADLESPSLASVPIALADDYSLAALTAFLLDPLASHPASRMPAQHLSSQEAADLAAYLHTGQTPAAFQERRILNLPAQTAERGRELFARHRCTACHETGEALPSAARLPSLSELKPDAKTGCLSGEVRTGIPRHDLSPLQTRALRLALGLVQKQGAPRLEPAQQLSHHLARLNCYACHDHDGRGGPEIARAPYFSSTLRLRPNDDIQGLPPSLDAVRSNHDKNSLRKRLTAAEENPPPGTRMPRFTPEAVSPLLELLLRP